MLAIFCRLAKVSQNASIRPEALLTHFWSLPSIFRISKQQLGVPIQIWQQYSMQGRIVTCKDNAQRKEVETSQNKSRLSFSSSFDNPNSVKNQKPI